MLFDFESWEGSFVDKEYDVAIAGAGPAGISLARKLAALNKKVALLEGGGLTATAESQAIYQPDPESDDSYVNYARLRFFGGTSNHWAGRCRPFEEIDFEERPDVYGMSGWPIGLEEIQPYLEEAKDILDLGATTPFVAREGTYQLSKGFKKDEFLLSSPTRFHAKYLDELTSSEQIDLYVNANVVDITQNNQGEIASFTIQSYQNKKAFVEASAYVLATGAIENARILLNANSQVSDGIGNQTDMVGRCFMEHFNVRMGEFIPSAGMWNDISRMSYYTDNAFCEEEQILSSNVVLSVNQSARIDGRAQGIKRPLVNFACARDLQDKLSKLFSFRCAGAGLVTTLTEQEPNPDSRISLGDSTDYFGKRRSKSNWQMSELDKRSIRAIAKEMAMQATEAGLGRFKLPEYVLDENLEIEARSHAHHMGTTRMSESEEQGVVDKNCRVFGTQNLYIAGASVFSRGGACNPTMPLIQFALRLGDHLAAEA